MKDYYKILGLDFEAETEVIQYAYKALCRKYHPDKYKGSNAEEKMKEINEAFETLMDPIKRSNYDKGKREPFASEKDKNRNST